MSYEIYFEDDALFIRQGNDLVTISHSKVAGFVNTICHHTEAWAIRPEVLLKLRHDLVKMLLEENVHCCSRDMILEAQQLEKFIAYGNVDDPWVRTCTMLGQTIAQKKRAREIGAAGADETGWLHVDTSPIDKEVQIWTSNGWRPRAKRSWEWECGTVWKKYEVHWADGVKWNILDENEVVTHWMPSPSPPESLKNGNDE